MINEEGLKLLVDFIPNHFSADTHLLGSMPELFLPGDEELMSRDGYTFFRSKHNKDKIFAHGRDPLFPPWTDTLQVNYFSQEARDIMTEKLYQLSLVADGVRCDMAMLPLNNVFHNTWIGIINRFKFKKPDCEFWKTAIQKVKSDSPEFIFLGEVYWDLEWHMQQLGFDFTYDKRLTERLTYNDVQGVKAHLTAEKSFQQKSVRFLENHDEARAVTRLGKMRSLAAATIISTIQGMRFFYDGQFEGRKIKVPLQLGRQPEEKVSRTVSGYYNTLLKVTSHKIFREGEWSFIEPVQAASGNLNYNNFLIWEWKLGKDHAMVIVNFSEVTSQCRIRLLLEREKEEIVFTDLLTGENYKRNTQELNSVGLFIELKSYQSHILFFTEE
jgi:glycosidase